MDFSPEFRRKQKEILAQYKNKDVVEIKPEPKKPQKKFLMKLSIDETKEAWDEACSRDKANSVAVERWSDANNVWFAESETEVDDRIEKLDAGDDDYEEEEED